MGYFNYFIKCIIRNIAYKLCKPKVFCTIILSVAILLILHSTGYCADWTDGEIEACLDGLSTITSNQGTIISQLSSMGVNVSDIENELRNINQDIETIKTSLNTIDASILGVKNRLDTVITRLETVNTNISNIYNKLDTNQKELLNKLDLNNEKVLTELEEIKNILVGSSEETTELFLKQDNSYYYLPNPNGSSVVTKVYSSNPGNGRNLVGSHFKHFSNDTDFIFEKGYTYTVTLQIQNAYSGGGRFYYTYDNISVGNEIKVNYLGTFTQSSFSFTITPVRDGVISLLAENFGPFWKEQAHYTISKVPNGSLSSIGDNLNNVNDSINQGNQLQQEQNDFLKQETSDDDVSVDGFNSVDSNDITSDGLSGVFTNIYNSINSWSSKDINLPIPYTNKSITIPANYTYDMLNSFGGGWIIIFINSIYYFIVARFIIYSITSIINSIKSGSILETDNKNNITTDML